MTTCPTVPVDPKELRTLGGRLMRAACNLERGKPAAPVIPMRDILLAVAVEANQPLDALRGPRRFRALFWPRAEAMRRMHDEAGYSLPQIGRYFSGRDHTSVLYAVRRARVKRAMEVNG